MFDCDKCNSLCCVNPPMISSYEELKRAMLYGAEIVATEARNGGYMLAVAKVNDGCPFKAENRCLIYENRFDACRRYKCPMYGHDEMDAIEMMLNGKAFQHEKPDNEPYTVSRSTLKKLGIKPMKIEKAIQKTIATNMSTLAEEIEKTIAIIGGK